MNDIKIGFVDYFQYVDEFIINVSSKYHNIIRDDNNPDFLFFCDSIFGTKNLQYTNAKKIFLTGENSRFNNADKYIGPDHPTNNNMYRLPNYSIDNWVMVNKLKMTDVRIVERNESADTKEDFCSFLISNPRCTERNNFFLKLCDYKKVSSAGHVLNNVGYVLNGRNQREQHLQNKINYIKKFKFHICYENASYPGYTTEKLMHALYANTLPIYWGSETVSVDFNPNAFVNRANFDSDEEMIEYIQYLDNNDEEYNKILSEPIFHQENPYLNLDKLSLWLKENVYA